MPAGRISIGGSLRHRNVPRGKGLIVAAPGAQSGHTLGKYRLIAELGHGGMADVYLAVSRGPAGFHKLLVVKQLRPDLAEDPEFLTMFLDEARLAARLSHRNVVQTYEVAIDDGAYFLAMEYLDGQPLRRVVHRAKPNGVPLAMHLRILSETLAGLHHAHELHDFDGTPLAVVHRDVSPHNIFVTYTGEVKVVDFGIAKALDSSAETGAGVMKGKLAYMSPEQARSERVDRRADIFSMGVLMWEAIAGRRMWEGMTSAAIVSRLVRGDLPVLRDAVPSVDPDLEQICLRALSCAPEDRFDSAAEFQRTIDHWLNARQDHTSYDDIGAFVSSMFVEDRRVLQAVVERQLAAVNAMSTGEFLALQLPELERSLTGTLTPSGDKQSRTGSSSSSSRRRPAALDASHRNGSTPAPTVRDSALPRHPRTQASRWPLVAVLGALSAVGIVALAFGVRGSPADPGPQGLAAASAVPPSASQPVRVTLRIDVQPGTAAVYVDGARLISPDRSLAVAPGTTHAVRAEQDGFVAVARDVTVVEDTTLDLILDRTPSSPTASAVRPPGPGHAPPNADIPARKRPLDTQDPWAQ